MRRGFRSRRSADWSLADVAPLPGVPLFDHVNRLIAECGDGPLPGGGDPLPDEPPPDPAKVRFGAGVMDGIGAVRSGPGATQAAVVAASAVLDLLKDTPTGKKVHAVAERLAAIEGPHSYDQLLNSLTSGSANRLRLAELSRWLCTHGVDRQQVKAGIAMLGVSGTADDCGLVTQLGRLEELTLYSLVALSNLLEARAEQAIFALARQVDGWGRIHAFYRLADTTDADIKSWMLRGGFANDVMDEEVAYIAAATAGLKGALEGDVDDDLLDWSGRLLVALAMGGPAKDMSDYPGGAAALDAYLAHMASAAPSLKRLQHMFDIERYLTGWAADNPLITQESRTGLAERVGAILDHPAWKALAAAGLNSGDLITVKGCLRLARRFGCDPLPVVRDWLPREPYDGYLWQTILADASRGEIRELVQLASEILPFAAVTTGPAKDLGVGPEYRVEACLDQLLQRLQKLAGEGWDAIQLGLTCRVTRTRNLAIRALAGWPRDSWPDGAEDALRRLLFQEPDDGVRQRVKDLLDGMTEGA